MANQKESFYNGRLVADGDGNLLADEGDLKGYPVAFHEGNYVFVGPGEPSHNERHHQNAVNVAGTVDESMTDDPSLVNVTADTNQHHFNVLPDDPHYQEGATDSFGRVTNVKVKTNPDAIAAKITGHTEAYNG